MQRYLGTLALLGAALALGKHWWPTLCSNERLAVLGLRYVFWHTLSYCRNHDMKRMLYVIFFAAIVCGYWTMGFFSGVGLTVGIFTIHPVFHVPVVNAADVFEVRREGSSIHFPKLLDSLTQQNVGNKLNKYYKGSDDFRARVDGQLVTVAALLLLECCNRVMAVATNRYNVADASKHDNSNAGQRSSAKLGKATRHHLRRGARAEADCYVEAAEADRLMTEIMTASGERDYGKQLEFLLTVCTIYLVKARATRTPRLCRRWGTTSAARTRPSRSASGRAATNRVEMRWLLFWRAAARRMARPSTRSSRTGSPPRLAARCGFSSSASPARKSSRATTPNTTRAWSLNCVRRSRASPSRRLENRAMTVDASRSTRFTRGSCYY